LYLVQDVIVPLTAIWRIILCSCKIPSNHRGIISEVITMATL